MKPIAKPPFKLEKSHWIILEKLSNAVGVSGNEDEIRELVRMEISSHVDEVKVDSLGNLLAIKHAKKPGGVRLMLAAHMDEVGFMLVDDEGEGLFAFDPVGGIDERQLIAKQVLVGPDHIPGVIGAKPIHLSGPDEHKHPVPMRNLRIDVSPANAGKVSIGMYATFATRFRKSQNSIWGKALDDRLGVATLIGLTRLIPENLEVLFAFTVQEEIGLRGARVAGYDFKPDLAWVIDSTPAFDLPMENTGSENTRYNCRLGAGPAIYLADAGTISDPRLIQFLVSVAKDNQIPFQFRQPGGGGTDAGAIHITATGIPSVSISIPGRYAHSTVLHAQAQDWENTIRLLDAAACQLNHALLDIPR